jgi:hypothetical protein
MENDGERWRELCEQATKEDPARLLELTAEITKLLDENGALLRGRKESVA